MDTLPFKLYNNIWLMLNREQQQHHNNVDDVIDVYFDGFSISARVSHVNLHSLQGLTVVVLYFIAERTLGVWKRRYLFAHVDNGMERP